jgi:hypothetical protein
MITINNTDTGDGKVRYSYRISLILKIENPIERMKFIMNGNANLSSWIQLNSSHIYKYKISGHELFLETGELVELFKKTYNGKESKDYIIKSLRKKSSKQQPPTRKSRGTSPGDKKSKKHVVTVRPRPQSPKVNPNKLAPAV